jgi:hypothetical protein
MKPGRPGTSEAQGRPLSSTLPINTNGNEA